MKLLQSRANWVSCRVLHCCSVDPRLLKSGYHPVATGSQITRQIRVVPISDLHYRRGVSRLGIKLRDPVVADRVRSFLRHPGFAQPGEIRGFVQIADLRHSLPDASLAVSNAGKKISAV
jgi:hypothetical protein